MSAIVRVAALLLGSALLMFAGGLQGLILPIRGGQEGFSLWALGLLGTGWSVGYIAGTLSVPVLVSRVGHIRAFSVMAAVGSIVILLNALIVEQYAWILLRAFSGFCFAGAAMIVESWLNEVSDNAHRGTVFSAYTMANLVFSTIGQLTITVTGEQGFEPFAIGAIAFAFAVMPTALTLSTPPRPLARAKLDLPLLFRTSPIAMIAAFCIGISGGCFGTLVPIYGVQIGLDSGTIAYLLSLSVVVGAFGQLPIGRISDLMDRRIVITFVSIASATAGLIMVIVNPSGGWLLWGIFAFYGLAANSLYPVAVAHANDYAKEGDFAPVASGLLLIYGIGLAIGPLLGSGAMSLISPVALFLVTATVHLGLAIFAVIRMQMRAPATEEERNPFQVTPQGRDTTLQTVVLDPRTEEEWLEEVTEPEWEYTPLTRDEEEHEDPDGLHGGHEDSHFAPDDQPYQDDDEEPVFIPEDDDDDDHR